MAVAYLSGGVEVVGRRSEEERALEYQSLDLLVREQGGVVVRQQRVEVDAARQRTAGRRGHRHVKAVDVVWARGGGRRLNVGHGGSSTAVTAVQQRSIQTRMKTDLK